MPARDLYHEHVRNALINDGWNITHDLLRLEWATTNVQIDLGAEQLLVAEKDARKIAVEVKSFLSESELTDLYSALGQFLLYRKALAKKEPERILFLAIREAVFLDVFAHPDNQDLCSSEQIKLLVFNPDRQEIVRWIE